MQSSSRPPTRNGSAATVLTASEDGGDRHRFHTSTAYLPTPDPSQAVTQTQDQGPFPSASSPPHHPSQPTPPARLVSIVIPRSRNPSSPANTSYNAATSRSPSKRAHILLGSPEAQPLSSPTKRRRTPRSPLHPVLRHSPNLLSPSLLSPRSSYVHPPPRWSIPPTQSRLAGGALTQPATVDDMFIDPPQSPDSKPSFALHIPGVERASFPTNSPASSIE